MAASFTADDELHMMELELSILRKKQELAKAKAQPRGLVLTAPPDSLTSVSEVVAGLGDPAESSSSCWLDLGKAKLQPNDDVSDSTGIGVASLVSDLESFDLKSEAGLDCSYYTVSDGKFYDAKGKEQT